MSGKTLKSTTMSNSRTLADNLPEINTLIIDQDKTNTLGYSAMLARSGVPESHKRAADNYMIIKRVFGFPVVQSKVSIDEERYLARFDFNELECSTIRQINEELCFLKKWSNTDDFELQMASDKVVQIRLKELKHLVATNHVSITNEIYCGYKALERYFEEISKYCG